MGSENGDLVETWLLEKCFEYRWLEVMILRKKMRWKMEIHAFSSLALSTLFFYASPHITKSLFLYVLFLSDCGSQDWMRENRGY